MQCKYYNTGTVTSTYNMVFQYMNSQIETIGEKILLRNKEMNPLEGKF